MKVLSELIENILHVTDELISFFLRTFLFSQPFKEFFCGSLSDGFGDSEPVVNWLFDESSLDGKFKASEMIARWQDKGWITRTNNEHPLAYMAAAMRNLHTLISHHIGQAPKVELVKRGNKTLVIPEGTPESQLGLLINKFTRG